MAGAESSRPITSGSHCLALRELVRVVRREPLRLLGPHELLHVYHSPISLSSSTWAECTWSVWVVCWIRMWTATRTIPGDDEEHKVYL